MLLPGKGASITMQYQPHLDGLRAFAAIAVLLYHTRVPGFAGGYLGVDVFFVLSGYLITSLLVREQREKAIDVRGFYGRRARRLLPAYVFFLATYTAVGTVLQPAFPHMLGALVAGAYLTDYIPHFAPAKYLLHTWSLSAEAHFYFVWPVLLIAVAQRFGAMAIRKFVFWTAVVGTGWAVGTELLGFGAYYRMDSRIYQMAWGGWLALVQLDGVDALNRHRRPVAIGGAIVLGYLVFLGLPAPLRTTIASPIAAVASVAVLHGAGTLPLDRPTLVWLGKMSYGIYLWHYPIAVALRETHPALVTAPTTLILSVAGAALSYYAVERIFRRKRPPTTPDAYQRAA